mgnify:CR=1 FL=1
MLESKQDERLTEELLGWHIRKCGVYAAVAATVTTLQVAT